MPDDSMPPAGSPEALAQETEQLRALLEQARADNQTAMRRIDQFAADARVKAEQMAVEHQRQIAEAQRAFNALKTEMDSRMSSGPSIRPGSPAGSGAFSQTARLEKPVRFSGERRRDRVPPHTWLFNVTEYLQITKQPKETWVQFASMLLDGAAQLWYESRHARLDATQRRDWDSFAESIRAQFEPVNSNKTARDTLSKLVQKGPVQTYCSQFNLAFLQVTDMTEAEAIDRFVRGLKVSIQTEVDLKEPKTLEEAMRVAQRYDQLSWRHRQYKELYENRPSDRRNSSYGNNYRNDIYSGPAPMEIGSSQVQRQQQTPSRQSQAAQHQQQRSQMTPAQRRINDQSKICYFCRRPGHTQRFCPERRPNQGQQFTGRPPGKGSAGRR